MSVIRRIEIFDLPVSIQSEITLYSKNLHFTLLQKLLLKMKYHFNYIANEERKD